MTVLGWTADMGMTMPDGVKDIVDDASTTNMLEMAALENERSGEVVVRIQEALDRIKDGVYGVCEDCRGNIAKTRLEVLPWAQYCIQCQRKIEELFRKQQ